MIIGADFDGTWTDHPEIWGQVDVIVTGNSWEMFQDVLEDYVGPRKPIMFNVQHPKEDILEVVNHKADMIKRIGITKFFEDQKEQVDMLKILCPSTEIVHVKPEMTFI